LVDAGDKLVFECTLVFRNLPERRSPFWRVLKRGFEHVECWKRVDAEAWVRLEPCFEGIGLEAYSFPPREAEWVAGCDPTFLDVKRVVSKGKLREPFMLGPVTCVEIVKAAIGLRAPLVRTPWQLYKRLT
jgi:hypothetical protein